MRCRNCGDGNIFVFLDLGYIPLANSLSSDIRVPDEKFPLRVAFCKNCSLVQITDIVPPEKLFREYVYLSSLSQTFLRHAKELSEKLIRLKNLNEDSFVVEIGSNDGYLLQYFVERNIPVLGIEPAINVAEIARQKGIPTISEFFNYEFACELSSHKKADVIIANNVLAHIPDIDSTIRGVRQLLKEDGIFVAEFPYVKDLIEKNEFDTIYHEHVYYFSLTSIKNIIESRGLVFIDFEWLPIHGGSLRIFVGKEGEPTDKLKRALDWERNFGINSFEFYERFAEKVFKLKEELVDTINTIVDRGESVAGYGAAAKATVLLNFLGLGNDKVKFVVDKNPIKQGKFIPGVKIPILPPDYLIREMPNYTIIFVWNIKDEVISQQEEYRSKGGKFIIPIPYPQVV